LLGSSLLGGRAARETIEDGSIVLRRRRRQFDGIGDAMDSEEVTSGSAGRASVPGDRTLDEGGPAFAATGVAKRVVSLMTISNESLPTET
jgi:hypothetical protein